MHQQHNAKQLQAVPQLHRSHRETDSMSDDRVSVNTHAYLHQYRQQTVQQFVVQAVWCIDATDNNTASTVHGKLPWRRSLPPFTASSSRQAPSRETQRKTTRQRTQDVLGFFFRYTNNKLNTEERMNVGMLAVTLETRL